MYEVIALCLLAHRRKGIITPEYKYKYWIILVHNEFEEILKVCLMVEIVIYGRPDGENISAPPKKTSILWSSLIYFTFKADVA